MNKYFPEIFKNIYRQIRSAYRKNKANLLLKNNRLPELELEKIVSRPILLDPPIVEKLCLPPFFGPTTHDDIRPLLALIQHFKPKAVLELGTAHGATVANICSVCDAKIFTVNALPEQIAGSVTTFTLQLDEIGYVFRKYGFQDRVTQIMENTRILRATDYIPPASVDFVIIDACHDVDFVISDFFMVQPVVHKGTIILFHDVHPSFKEHLLDSYVACMYLRKIGFDIKHIENTWWAYLQMTDDDLQLASRVVGHYQNGHNKKVENYIKDAVSSRFGLIELVRK